MGQIGCGPDPVTQIIPTRQLRFFMTAVAPCPYLPGMTERKVFANLPFSDGAHVNGELTHAGFRRSQNIAYRPACEGCDACVAAIAANVLPLLATAINAGIVNYAVCY